MAQAEDSSPIDSEFHGDILTIEEVAQYLRKSPSWVYKHWKILGGVKLGGSILFPSKEELQERLFGKGQGVSVRFHPPGDQAHGSLVQNKKRGKGGRGKKTGGSVEPANGRGGGEIGEDPSRHGLS